ncbi:MAG: hypothetical protein AVDCRST_MAG66-602 [uncultured Pseudonocardia sp.]|uniref:Lipoprotein n=1 Tax=uncultured Pseudonocardia sp. TaxID=211455 RepID=A0A6J4NID7_9PSEU|nr:MAG: hypothetical protein AVDCRST_MAG66-602 [uncultured Pseudonocardia sp.]
MSRLVALALLTLLVLTACTSRTSSCINGVCTVGLSGEQTVDLEIGRVEHDLRVAPIEADAVTVSVRGDAARLRVGESAPLGGLLVRVDGIAGQEVDLLVQPA